MENTGLIRYDAMTRAIAEAHAVDEVKDIRDRAMAMERYAQQAMNVEAERQANEIRLRAERRFGELSAELEKDAGGRPRKNATHDDKGLSKAKALEQAGVTQQQASRWERLAKVRADDFEKALAADTKPTTNGILREHNLIAKRTAADNGALWLWGHMRALAEFCNSNEPNTIAKAIGASEKRKVIESFETTCEWFEKFNGGE